jgi:hypothetical protein
MEPLQNQAEQKAADGLEQEKKPGFSMILET